MAEISNARLWITNPKTNLWLLGSRNQHILCFLKLRIIQYVRSMAWNLEQKQRGWHCSFNSRWRRGNDGFLIRDKLDHEDLHRSTLQGRRWRSHAGRSWLLRNSWIKNQLYYDIDILIYFYFSFLSHPFQMFSAANFFNFFPEETYFLLIGLFCI